MRVAMTKAAVFLSASLSVAGCPREPYIPADEPHDTAQDTSTPSSCGQLSVDDGVMVVALEADMQALLEDGAHTLQGRVGYYHDEDNTPLESLTFTLEPALAAAGIDTTGLIPISTDTVWEALFGTTVITTVSVVSVDGVLRCSTTLDTQMPSLDATLATIEGWRMPRWPL